MAQAKVKPTAAADSSTKVPVEYRTIDRIAGPLLRRGLPRIDQRAPQLRVTRRDQAVYRHSRKLGVTVVSLAVSKR